MKILIYTDNVSNNHLVYYSLGKLFGKSNVAFINANEILAGALTSEIDVLVMPGGASRYKTDKLAGKGHQLIREYIANGGHYLGICAGSYMACTMTYWAQHTDHEIITENELNFFPGRAQGPLEPFGRGDNYNGTPARLVTLNMQGERIPSLYLGGCAFIPSVAQGYEVLATFDDLPDKPAAIVQGDYGQGAWLLCSTHPEYDHEAVGLLSFDVIGNDYQAFSSLETDARLNLDLLRTLITQLVS